MNHLAVTILDNISNLKKGIHTHFSYKYNINVSDYNRKSVFDTLLNAARRYLIS